MVNELPPVTGISSPAGSAKPTASGTGARVGRARRLGGAGDNDLGGHHIAILLGKGVVVVGTAAVGAVRPGVSRLTFEFHHRLDSAPHVLTVPLGVEGAEAAPSP